MKNSGPKRKASTRKARVNAARAVQTMAAEKPTVMRHHNEEETDSEQALIRDGRMANLTSVRHGSSHNERYAAMRRGSEDELAA